MRRNIWVMASNFFIWLHYLSIYPIVLLFFEYIFKNAAVFELPYCTIHIKSLESKSENDNSGECAVNTYLQHCGMCRVIVNCRSKGMNFHAGSKFYTF